MTLTMVTDIFCRTFSNNHHSALKIVGTDISSDFLLLDPKLCLTKTQRAGITFSVARVHRQLRYKGKYAKRIRIFSAVYVAVVLEYLVAEILELAGKEAEEQKRKQIIPRHIMLAIRKDEELNSLLKEVSISFSGVVPNIQTPLLAKEK